MGTGHREKVGGGGGAVHKQNAVQRKQEGQLDDCSPGKTLHHNLRCLLCPSSNSAEKVAERDAVQRQGRALGKGFLRARLDI